MKNGITRILFVSALCLLSTIATLAEMTFSKIPPKIAAGMDAQRAFVSKLVASKVPGKTLTRSSKDFDVLQALVDKQVLNKSQTWELQALGVCFGDALIEYIPGLRWALVTDEFGTDPTLRYRETTTQFNAQTMISKRVEDGRAVELWNLANYLKGFIKKESPEFGASK